MLAVSTWKHRCDSPATLWIWNAVAVLVRALRHGWTGPVGFALAIGAAHPVAGLRAHAGVERGNTEVARRRRWCVGRTLPTLAG